MKVVSKNNCNAGNTTGRFVFLLCAALVLQKVSCKKHTVTKLEDSNSTSSVASAVKASDKGNETLNTSELHHNEIPPTWDCPTYGPIFISENVPLGIIVASVKASSGIYGNPTVFYQIRSGAVEKENKYDTFILQERQENGYTWADITVNHPLDFNRKKEYNLALQVENNGAQQLASETTVQIIIEKADEQILGISS